MPDLFEAIAAPARRAILDELTDRDGQTLFELCTRLTMKHGLSLTRQAISQHLDALEQVGLITTEREGKYKFHYIDTAPLKTIVNRWLTPEATSEVRSESKSKRKQKPKSNSKRKTKSTSKSKQNPNQAKKKKGARE
jgi:DNA-binding transcriptional ArsR family regulator